MINNNGSIHSQQSYRKTKVEDKSRGRSEEDREMSKVVAIVHQIYASKNELSNINPSCSDLTVSITLAVKEECKMRENLRVEISIRRCIARDHPF